MPPKTRKPIRNLNNEELGKILKGVMEPERKAKEKRLLRLYILEGRDAANIESAAEKDRKFAASIMALIEVSLEYSKDPVCEIAMSWYKKRSAIDANEFYDRSLYVHEGRDAAKIESEAAKDPYYAASIVNLIEGRLEDGRPMSDAAKAWYEKSQVKLH